MKTFYYKIKKGDNLTLLSKRQKCSIEQIQYLNPKITNVDLIYAGDEIILPEIPDCSSRSETSDRTKHSRNEPSKENMNLENFQPLEGSFHVPSNYSGMAELSSDSHNWNVMPNLSLSVIKPDNNSSFSQNTILSESFVKSFQNSSGNLSGTK
jgi:hypothetical protein